jgi:uncharacterized membrane protein
MILKNKRGSTFVNIIAIIGAILIFVGVAWLIAKNWHQIPDVIKISILVFSTFASFISGVLLRQNKHEGVGRSLIILGALLYILSLFLISQIYNLATSMQHYAWLLFLAWTIILITAYFLDSPENLVISMLTFFPWAILQYLSSLPKTNLFSQGEIVFGLVSIFLSAGAILYGLSIFHNSIKHKFTNPYRFWTIFYFILIFYVLSFQSLLPILSKYSFEASTFSIFLVLFVFLCFIGFVIGTLFAIAKNSISIKEIVGFLLSFNILFILILLTKIGKESITDHWKILMTLPTSLWLLWMLNNFVFIGFIILIIWYGQSIGSTKIVNLGLIAFILEIITRYIGFWLDFKGYFAFSILAILGGLLLILGSWLIPRWRKKLLNKTNLIQNTIK